MATKKNDPHSRFIRDVSGSVITYIRLHRDDVKEEWDADVHAVERTSFDARDLPSFADLPDKFFQVGKEQTVGGFLVTYGVSKALEDRTSQVDTDEKLAARAAVFEYLKAGHVKDPEPKTRQAGVNWLALAIADSQGVSPAKATKWLAKRSAEERKALSEKLADTIDRLKAEAADDEADLDDLL